MAQPGAFIPAWKRLGLKLKKVDQSAEPDSNGHQVHQNQQTQTSAEQGSASKEHIDSSQNTSSKTKLGKRKHHSYAADEEGESSKKSKHDQEHDPATGHAVMATETEKVSHKTAPLEAPCKAPPADTTQSKGDANYRKKKGDSNYRKKKENNHTQGVNDARRDNQKQPAQSLAAPKHVRTPSLSPRQPDLAPNDSTLLASTESEFSAPFSLITPKKRKSPDASTKDDSSSLSPPKTDRRKSVTFTPDTKTSDGNSASNLFKKWVADQKGPGADFSSAEVAQFTEPPNVHIANSIPSSMSTVPKDTTTSTKGKKKDPSRYLNYLTQYHQDRANWKFNKAIQNDVLEYSLNIFRIPEQYSEALVEYVRGLKGAGVIDRLKVRCTQTIDEVNEAEAKEASTMDAPESRKAAKEDALEERLSKERKRRRVEGDIENMLDHPHTEGYIRRLKRNRAEALLSALHIAAPASATPQSGLEAATPKTSEVARSLAQKDVRKRKKRTEVSSDESSDSSSSEESSSSEDSSDEDSSGSGSTSSDQDEESSDSGSGSDSDSSDSSGGSGDESASSKSDSD